MSLCRTAPEMSPKPIHKLLVTMIGGSRAPCWSSGFRRRLITQSDDGHFGCCVRHRSRSILPPIKDVGFRVLVCYRCGNGAAKWSCSSVLGRGQSKKEEVPSPRLSPQSRGEELYEHNQTGILPKRRFICLQCWDCSSMQAGDCFEHDCRMDGEVPLVRKSLEACVL